MIYPEKGMRKMIEDSEIEERERERKEKRGTARSVKR